MAPYLQLVLTKLELWKKDRLSLEEIKDCREVKETQEKIDKVKEGIKGIVRNYVKETISNLEKEIIKGKERNKKLETLGTVHRLLYYLSTPSGSKHVLSAKEVADYAEEEANILKLLDMPTLEKNNIEKLFKKLENKRILRSINSPKSNEKRYEIYFEGLSEAIQACRKEYITQLRDINEKQNLPVKALAALRRGDIESAAASAREAYESYNECGYPTNLASLYEALYEVLKFDYLSCRIEDLSIENYKPEEKAFWQVIRHPNPAL